MERADGAPRRRERSQARLPKATTRHKDEKAPKALLILGVSEIRGTLLGSGFTGNPASCYLGGLQKGVPSFGKLAYTTHETSTRTRALKVATSG